MTDPAYLLIGDGREYLLEPGEEFGTDLGVLKLPADAEHGDVVETHLGEAFEVRELRLPDLFDHLERTGAPMMPRDVGLVIGHVGIAAGDRVLDAGTGTGILAAALGRAGATVRSYERDPEFADVARENMRIAGVDDRVDVRTGDLAAVLAGDEEPAEDGAEPAEPTEPTEPTEGDADRTPVEDRFDVLTLDTGDAADVVAHAPDVLVPGGFLAAYSPFVEGTRAIVEAAREVGLEGVETLETIQREMDFSERGSRPSTAGVGHTGYLTFARRP
ncbi:50S ribosomal protein L11 methyltransferase [Halopenitus persicus]|uniref:tRNA (Adenine57-N1/adenine58-N1)-methyltransferase n=1 Tax=Halopenitus persicus TaxID=1048396 RepID=A0A1H3GXS3_9EURY|nr:50S ribosomal protein L11 methyltransferase [Halopenitus persicus]SDY08041.1 tRNA (adenine57-N1/adenine58-N1)-methyltransferase [Halopenitus persicus]